VNVEMMIKMNKFKSLLHIVMANKISTDFQNFEIDDDGKLVNGSGDFNYSLFQVLHGSFVLQTSVDDVMKKNPL
jgi:hypothetical protein